MNASGADLCSLRAGLQAVRHRGPDGQGVQADGAAAIGHSRLALTGGPEAAQPIALHRGFGAVNGELYNHRSLAQGLACRTRSDSEVLLRRLQRDGVRALQQCEGAFAAIVWDGERLLAVRDRFGIKPLYWAWDGRCLRVASEAAALFAMGVNASWDQASVDAMMSHQYLPPERTVFAGVRVLEPGCWLEARPGEAPVVGRWWSWQGEIPECPSESLHDALRQAVRVRCEADQPVACQLSGGLDSSLIAAFARSAGVRTAYTVAFDGEAHWNEAEAAARIAQHLDLEHRVLRLDQRDLLEHLDSAVLSAGGPVINTHAAAKLLLCRQVRADGHAVLLSGEGADELFWGYEHLIRDHNRSRGLADTVASAGVAGIHLPAGEALDTSAVARRWGVVPSFLQAKASLGHRLHQLLEHPVHQPFETLLDSLGTPPEGSSATVAAWAWARLCLAGSILQRLCDPLEMAAGVEGRMPFLDRRVVAYAARVDVDQRVSLVHGKLPLRNVAKRLLPPGSADAPKQPFMGPPLHIDADLRSRLLDGPQLPFIRRDALEDLLIRHANAPTTARVPWDPVWLTVLSCQALQRGHRL